jgi:hypothetical protein
MTAFQKALRLKPEGFFFCPAFLPPKTNLTRRAQDFRGYVSFALFGIGSEETSVTSATDAISVFVERSREHVPALLFAPQFVSGVRGEFEHAP